MAENKLVYPPAPADDTAPEKTLFAFVGHGAVGEILQAAYGKAAQVVAPWPVRGWTSTLSGSPSSG